MIILLVWRKDKGGRWGSEGRRCSIINKGHFDVFYDFLDGDL